MSKVKFKCQNEKWKSSSPSVKWGLTRLECVMHARFNVRPPVNVETINHQGIRQLSFGRDLCRTEVQKPLRSPTSRKRPWLCLSHPLAAQVVWPIPDPDPSGNLNIFMKYQSQVVFKLPKLWFQSVSPRTSNDGAEGPRMAAHCTY